MKFKRDHGLKLVKEFDRFIADHERRAAARQIVVLDRLAALEDEHADLKQHARKITAAKRAA